jgi:hypothetical protein
MLHSNLRGTCEIGRGKRAFRIIQIWAREESQRMELG